jgi:hypothetical protein
LNYRSKNILMDLAKDPSFPSTFLREKSQTN